MKHPMTTTTVQHCTPISTISALQYINCLQELGKSLIHCFPSKILLFLEGAQPQKDVFAPASSSASATLTVFHLESLGLKPSAIKSSKQAKPRMPVRCYGRLEGCWCEGSHPSTTSPSRGCSTYVRPSLPFQRLKLFTERIRKEERVD